MNRPVSRAHVIGRCATWHCVCGEPVALQGRSGRVSGPTRETAIVCSRCQRAYFVIPMDRSFGAPIEVVELFELPAEAGAEAATRDEPVASESAPPPQG
jgi:hypothetical protein